MWNLQLAEQELEGHLHTEDGEEADGAPRAPLRQRHRSNGSEQRGKSELPGSSSSSEDEGGPSSPADAAAGMRQR